MARGLVVALFGCDRSLCRFRVSLSNKIPGSVVLMAVVFWLRVRRWTMDDGRWAMGDGKRWREREKVAAQGGSAWEEWVAGGLARGK